MTQPDFENSQLRRRASDFTQAPTCPCGKEMLDTLQHIQNDLRDIKHGMGTIRTAFVRNDLGDPDYEGHRQDHLARIQKNKEIDQLKMAGAVKFVGAMVAVIVTIFGTGLSTQLQKLFGG